MVNRVGQVQRRDILRGLGGGALAAAFGSLGLRPGRVAAQEQKAAGAGKGQLFTPYAKPAKVTLIKGNDRRDIIFQTLKNIEDDIMASIGAKKKILVNLIVSVRIQWFLLQVV